MSHTRAGIRAYEKASPVTMVEVADETIPSVDEFGTIELDLDQPGSITKPVKITTVAYGPGPLRNLLSILKALKNWGKSLIYNRTKAILRFPGEESLVFNLCPRKCFFSVTGVRRPPSQKVVLTLAAKMTQAMRIATTNQRGSCEARSQAKGNSRPCSGSTGLSRSAATVLVMRIST